MFARILVAIDGFGQHPAALDLVKSVATDGTTQVRVLHLRLREVSGFSWYARETGSEAAFVADAAVFDLRMAGLAAGGDVRYAAVDRVAEAILREAEVGPGIEHGESAGRPLHRHRPLRPRTRLPRAKKVFTRL